MKKLIHFLSTALTIISFSSVGIAVDEDSVSRKSFELKGSAQIRQEGINNSGFNATDDKYNYLSSRFRLDFNFFPHKNVDVFVQPQFSKIWGSNELGVNTNLAGAASESSGGLNNTVLDVHQAYLLYRPTDMFEFKVGRQELVYGDQLVLGSVGWHYIARSFDALRFKTS